ncbi:AprI/Inh family metalloprotease inhibitor [Pseudovibrio sp. Ad26]|uniref:AprI/Inh family metalloprotease inhibitor n=1 Tax=Pseudovibrio sp. Ad26 TaxID=989410 RepID=UPI0007AE7438|nr:AprI/Inh family metalloprotease inhibitor [Pseudovibrio sp. Ad26]KZL05660.1 Protease inhibitor Inh [Pseudovibrio sp. Ad26]
MRFKTFIISIGFAVAGCVPTYVGDPADLAELAVKKSNANLTVASTHKTTEKLAAIAALAGKWSVIRGEGQTPCALQLKTAQFGGNYAASSVCSGEPNVWSWNMRQDVLLLFDHRSQVIASFHESEGGNWREAREGGDPALGLVRLGD